MTVIRLLSACVLSVSIWMTSPLHAASEFPIRRPAQSEDNRSGDRAGIASPGSQTSTQNIGKVGSSSFDSPTFLDRFSVSYYGYFFGPSIEKPSSYQPLANGNPDILEPVHFRNFLALGFGLRDQIAISAAAQWAYIPVLGQRVEMRDPYVRLSHDSILSIGAFNWSGDIRAHFPVHWFSQDIGLLVGLQSFHAFTYSPAESRFSVGALLSARTNFLSLSGQGYDWELYAAPNIAYQVSPRVALTALYELATNHLYGEDPFVFSPGEPDLELGVSWNITNTLNIQPYLNIMTREGISARSTSLAATATWFIY